jgi:hypothetical protein
LFGKFNYEKQGILDESHLHFYTLNNAIELVEGAGYRIEKIVPYITWNKRHKIIYRYLLKYIPTLLAKQFFIVCKKKQT